MNTLQDNVRECLLKAADGIAAVHATTETRLRKLADDVDQPCVVAVVGRVKAGKSSFVNALLGDDKAMVGTTETTATINHFVYGFPGDPGRPVRCFWGDGSSEDCDQAFLARLQGHDIDTLKLANGVDRLEYRIPNAFLRQATLVDTPGTGAVVDEHQDRSADYLGLVGQLRKRHDEETRAMQGRADAIIYLTGAVARHSDRAFLEEFAQATRGEVSALNAVGVIAKIDTSPTVLARSSEFVDEIASQLRDSLNTVVAVSAGLRRAADLLCANDCAALRNLVAGIRGIPADLLDKMLSDEELFLDVECPVPEPARRAMRSSVEHWSVFTAIASIAADGRLSVAEVGARIEQLSGFDKLRKILHEQFFARGHILRCFRIMNDAKRLLRDLTYDHLPPLRDEARAAEARHRRFADFLARAGGDHAVRRDLTSYLDTSFAERIALPKRCAEAVSDAERLLAETYRILDDCNAEFGALQKMREASDQFSDAEKQELEPLLGRYGLDLAARLPSGRVGDSAFVRGRQVYWNQRTHRERDPVRRLVAEAAVYRYGLIIADILKP